MKCDHKEAQNIEKVLKSFSGAVLPAHDDDVGLTYVSGDSICFLDNKGGINKLKNIEKNVRVEKRFFKVRADKKTSDICGA